MAAIRSRRSLPSDAAGEACCATSVAYANALWAGRQADKTGAAKSAAPVTLAAAIASEPKLQAFRDEDPVVARAFDIASVSGLTGTRRPMPRVS